MISWACGLKSIGKKFEVSNQSLSSIFLLINGDRPEVNQVSKTNVSPFTWSAVYPSGKSTLGSTGHLSNCSSLGKIISFVLISYQTGIGIPNFLFLEIFQSRCKFSIQSFDLFFMKFGYQFILSFWANKISFLSKIFTNHWCTGKISTGTFHLSEMALLWMIGVLALTTHIFVKISIIFSLASSTFNQSISGNPVFIILPYLSIQIFGSNSCFWNQ